MMAAIEELLRKRAAELLESGEVVEVIGWGAGRFSNQTTPLFVVDPNKAQELVFNDYCVNTLGKPVMGEKHLGKLAVCVRGCDSRAINRMIADSQVTREQLYLLGIPCQGMKDRQNNQLLAKCVTCTHKNPVIYDELLGDLVEEVPAQDMHDLRFAKVQAVEELSREERQAHFDEVFNRCIRCYACREVCPVCTCRECFVDQQRAGWQGKQNNLEENKYYNLIRVFHIGDRCIECGECERVCPMELPLMELNRKWVWDLERLFDAGEEGLTDELDNALGRYKVEDIEEFM